MDRYTIQLRLSTKEKYPAKQHAQDVARKLGQASGLIYLLGQYNFTIEDSDMYKTWSQRRYFYYCSGVDVPDCCLTYDIESDVLTLYIPQIKPERFLWEGRGPTIEEAEETYDVDQVRLNSSLFSDLEKWTKAKPDSTFYILHRDHKPEMELPCIDCEKLLPAMNRCRVIKDSYEINCIRKANDISAKAHRAVLENIHRFTNENQIKATFEYVCTINNAKQSYPVIAGSGRNAALLHYTKDDEPLKGSQFVCLDAGAEFQNYTSDVTRTFPISGSWPSEEAKATYALVEEMQEACIAKVAPGVKMIDLHLLAIETAVRGLLQLGLLHNGTAEEIIKAGTYRAFYPHGLGHHVGLIVHDVLGLPIMTFTGAYPLLDANGAALPSPSNQPELEENMVITIEPGIYFLPFEFERTYFSSPVHSKYINRKVLDRYWDVGGVRIEDDILITASGHEVLSTAPKGEEAFKIIRDSGRLG